MNRFLFNIALAIVIIPAVAVAKQGNVLSKRTDEGDGVNFLLHAHAHAGGSENPVIQDSFSGPFIDPVIAAGDAYATATLGVDTATANCLGEGLISVPPNASAYVVEATTASQHVVSATSPAVDGVHADAIVEATIGCNSRYRVGRIPGTIGGAPDNMYTLKSELRVIAYGGPVAVLVIDLENPIVRVQVGGSWIEVFYIGNNTFLIQGVLQNQIELPGGGFDDLGPEEIFFIRYGGVNETFFAHEVVSWQNVYTVNAEDRTTTGAFRGNDLGNPGQLGGMWSFSTLAAGWAEDEE